jgi:hypothetical protein
VIASLTATAAMPIPFAIVLAVTTVLVVFTAVSRFLKECDDFTDDFLEAKSDLVLVLSVAAPVAIGLLVLAVVIVVVVIVVRFPVPT